jgi:hypothetical protein
MPKYFEKFFSNRKSLIILLFLKTQMEMFSDAIQRPEQEEATGFEVKKEIDLLIMKLTMQQNEMFLHSDVSLIFILLQFSTFKNGISIHLV